MRFSIKIVGAAGQGVLSVGAIIAKAVKRSNIHMLGYRENPSLIKGGTTTYQAELCSHPVYCVQKKVNIILSLSPAGLRERLTEVQKNGIIFHFLPHPTLTPEQEKFVQENNITLIHVKADEFLQEQKLEKIFENIYMLGALWKALGLPYEVVENVMKQWFAKKPDLLKKDLLCLQKGFEEGQKMDNASVDHLKAKEDISKDYIMDGTEALTLGAISAGVRAYFAYPMSPSTGLLINMAKYTKKTGVLVKQGEDEITVACMTIAASHMGTRSLMSTSGGGFDLMTEAFSMASMTETPVVVVLGQRPGPATGLPTWTCQSDLLLAIHSSHGESPKCVIAVSDIKSNYLLIAKAFNIAEKYQMVVVVLADKYGLEASQQINHLPEDEIVIDRGMLITDPSELEKLTGNERYDTASESGITKRWLPGAKAAPFNAQTDEHTGNGDTTEESVEAVASIDKRMRKLFTLKKNLPDPVLYGPEKGDMLFVGWGSTKMVMMDILSLNNPPKKSISYLHYEYLWPLKTEVLKNIFSKYKKVVLIEGNKLGQLGMLIKQESDCAIHFDDKILKYDGRPFFLDDILEYINKK